MNIMGYLHGHDPSACLVQNGKIVAFVEEERLIRQKHAIGIFPILSIAECLKIGGITIDEVDRFAFGYDAPRFGNGEIAEFYHGVNKRFPPDERTLGWQRGNLARHNPDNLERKLHFELRKHFGNRPFAKLGFYPHHKAHAVATYCLSGFDDALVLVLDGSGDHQCTTLWSAQGPNLELLHEINIPDSLGWFYSAITEYLGFDAYDGEYKVMGLASYGRANPKIRTALSHVLAKGMAGYDYYVSPDYIHRGSHTYSDRFSDNLVGLLGIKPRAHVEPITSIHEDLAYEAQLAVENCVLRLLSHFRTKTGIRNIALGGGVAQNVKLNGVIAQSELFDNVSVFPIPSDSGTSTGAALGIAQRDFGEEIRHPLTNVYLGPEYTEAEIERELLGCGLPANKVDDIENRVADLLCAGKIVGWFQGRMEAGARALGARSILADPRNVGSRDRVNGAIKYREYWRPFCPAVARDAASQFMQSDVDAPFMILTFKATELASRSIPAVVHIDGTMRVQTVSEADNPGFHRLLHAFGDRAGPPVLLNTSFNVKGEPIVCSPRDALRTFSATGLDALAIGPFLVEKANPPQN